VDIVAWSNRRIRVAVFQQHANGSHRTLDIKTKKTAVWWDTSSVPHNVPAAAASSRVRHFLSTRHHTVVQGSYCDTYMKTSTLVYFCPMLTNMSASDKKYECRCFHL